MAIKTTKVSDAKETVKKTTERKSASQKGTQKKPVEKKAATRMRTKKKTELFIQFAGYEVSQEDLIARVKDVWVGNGNKISEIITLSLYVKPEEYKAYYVINGSFAGALDL